MWKTYEEAYKATEFIRRGLAAQEWAKDLDKIPQFDKKALYKELRERIENQKSSSANAEERGEKRGESEKPIND